MGTEMDGGVIETVPLTFHRRLGRRTARCSFRRGRRREAGPSGEVPGSEWQERVSKDELVDEAPRDVDASVARRWSVRKHVRWRAEDVPSEEMLAASSGRWRGRAPRRETRVEARDMAAGAGDVMGGRTACGWRGTGDGTGDGGGEGEGASGAEVSQGVAGIRAIVKYRQHAREQKACGDGPAFAVRAFPIQISFPSSFHRPLPAFGPQSENPPASVSFPREGCDHRRPPAACEPTPPAPPPPTARPHPPPAPVRWHLPPGPPPLLATHIGPPTFSIVVAASQHARDRGRRGADGRGGSKLQQPCAKWIRQGAPASRSPRAAEPGARWPTPIGPPRVPDRAALARPWLPADVPRWKNPARSHVTLAARACRLGLSLCSRAPSALASCPFQTAQRVPPRASRSSPLASPAAPPSLQRAPPSRTSHHGAHAAPRGERPPIRPTRDVTRALLPPRAPRAFAPELPSRTSCHRPRPAPAPWFSRGPLLRHTSRRARTEEDLLGDPGPGAH